MLMSIKKCISDLMEYLMLTDSYLGVQDKKVGKYCFIVYDQGPSLHTSTVYTPRVAIHWLSE